MIVCLDQCAISRLAKCLRDGSPLHRLKDTLVESARQLKLICPVAKETIVETTGLSRAEERTAIYELHAELADAHLGGPLWSFKDISKMINEETLSLARSESPPSAFELINWNRIDDNRLAAETWTTVVESKKRMLERVKSFQKADSAKPVFEVTRKGAVLAVEHVSHVYRQVKRLLSGEPLDESDHMGYEVAQYLQRQGVSRSELEKLIQDLLHHRWEAIPVVFNRTQIIARLEADLDLGNIPRKYDANDEFDVPRIAVGLSTADLIITDAAMAQLCRSTKVERWTKTKVFAIREAEKITEFLQEFLTRDNAG